MKDSVLYIGLFVVCLSGALLAGTAGYFTHQARLSDWRQKAAGVLHVVLDEELSKRKDSIPFEIVSSRMVDSSPSGADENPKMVKIETEAGLNACGFSAMKDLHNVAQDPGTRAYHSILLMKRPLQADTLQSVWTDSLKRMRFPGVGLLRVVVNGDTLSGTKKDTEAWCAADSLAYFTLGYACEVEVLALGKLPWYRVCPWGYIVLALLCVGGSCWFLCKKKDCIYVLKKQREVEKMPPAVTSESAMSSSRFFLLKDGTVFYPDKLLLQKDGCSCNLTVQKADLLLLLVEAEGKYLSVQELMSRLWPDGTGTDVRLHQAVRRLNKALKEVSACHVENGRGAYRLVL